LLSKKDADAAVREVQAVFNEPPAIYLQYHQGAPLYEVVIFAPNVNNVGRGNTLKAAVDHLKQRNNMGANNDSKRH